MRIWASTRNIPAILDQVQKELAQTSLDWAVSLDNSGETIGAIRKFNHAIELAPLTDISNLARQHLANIYLRRGDDLVKGGFYGAGVTQYRIGLKFVSGTDQTRFQVSIANTYLKWAKVFMDQGDFPTALAKTTAAANINASDTVRTSAQAAQKELVQTFSNSTSEQAQKAIMDTAEIVCTVGGKPALPVFGLDTEQIRAAFYGLDLKFSEDLTSKTPGAVHYIVCVTERAVILESKNVRIQYTVQKFAPINNYKPWTNTSNLIVTGLVTKVLTRTQIFWDVNVIHLTTGEKVAQKTFDGSIPANLLFGDGNPVTVNPNSGLTYNGWAVESIRGDKPAISDVETWLQGYIN